MTRAPATALLLFLGFFSACGGKAPATISQTPGTWVNITPPSLSLTFSDFGNQNYGMQTIGLSASRPEVVYFGTCYQGIWKSIDSGDHFMKVNTGANGAGLDAGRNWTLAVDPTDPNILYTASGAGSDQGLWKSLDGGVDWTQLMPMSLMQSTTADVYSVAIDPQDHLHLLVGFHSGWAFGPDAGVIESHDGGGSWTMHPPAGAWGAGHYVMFIDSTTWLVGTQGNGYWRTTDSGTTWMQVTTENMQHGGNALYQTARGVIYAGSVGNLLRSTDRGAHFTVVSVVSTPDGYNSIIGDGTWLYAQPANTGSAGSPHPYYYSLETDGTSWMPFNAQMFSDGPMSMALDRSHQILFSSNWDAGVWRLVTGH